MPKQKKSLTLEQVLNSFSSANSFFQDYPISLNSVDDVGDTPLHHKVRAGNNRAVQILIAKGANLNAQGEMNETPLHIAIEQENLLIIEALLKHGAKTTLPSSFSETPIQLARQKGGEIYNLLKRYHKG